MPGRKKLHLSKGLYTSQDIEMCITGDLRKEVGIVVGVMEEEEHTDMIHKKSTKREEECFKRFQISLAFY